jgi:hypothetical protein
MSLLLLLLESLISRAYKLTVSIHGGTALIYAKGR